MLVLYPLSHFLKHLVQPLFTLTTFFSCNMEGNEVKKMSLPIVLIIIITIMGIFAFSIILLARKNNVSLKQTVDDKPIRTYKNGEQK